MQIIISHNNIKHLEKNNNNKPTENPIKCILCESMVAL